jgi:hypothetical protein
MPTTAKQSSNLSLFLQIAILLLVAGLLYRLLAPRAAGGTLPAFQVAGWLNGPPPDTEGRIVLLDVFATW